MVGTSRAVVEPEARPLAAQPHDAFGRVEHRLGRGAAGQHQHLGPGEFDVAAREGEADRLLGQGRRAVAGRPPEQDVGDVEVALAAHADGVEHAVHELAAHADERLAEAILVGARRLAHDHDRRARHAVGEHRVLGGALQRAALEGADRRLEFGDGGAASRELARILDELRRFERHRRADRGRRRGRADRCRRHGARRGRDCAWRGSRRRRGAKRSTASSPMVSSSPWSTYHFSSEARSSRGIAASSIRGSS